MDQNDVVFYIEKSIKKTMEKFPPKTMENFPSFWSTKKSIKKNDGFFDGFFCLILCFVLIDFPISLCCVACVFHCRIDVSADRNGSEGTQNTLNATLEFKKPKDELASLSKRMH